jgi:hypothetical protein
MRGAEPFSTFNSRVAAYKECPDSLAVDRLSAGEVADLDISVTDNNGCLLDFKKALEEERAIPSVYDERGCLTPPLPPDDELPRRWWGEYTAKPAYWTNANLVRLPLTVVDAEKGKFRAKVRQTDIAPGVYIAEASFYAPGRQLRLRERRWLEVEPTLRFVNNGPLTEQEVRLALRDYACYNTFLRREESSPTEIMFAVRRPVDLWNEIPPFVSPHTVATFPYRETWLQAAVGFLLRAHAHHRRRNEMTVNSSTIQMKDNDKAEQYDQAGGMALKEYVEWVRMTKVALNMHLGFGRLGSRYGSLAGGRR